MALTPDVDLWEDLLIAIEEGYVVPIVGRDLSVVEYQGRPRLLHEVVAERLASELRVSTADLPTPFDTHDVICTSREFRGDPMAVNPRVVRILRTLDVPVPEPLKLLAQIPDFSLFVSTSYDAMLEQAIAQERGVAPAVISFPASSDLSDLDDHLFTSHGGVVFQILGRASASAAFALTEGQVLEQMHDFMSSDTRPERLLDRLRESHLLLLGVNFPDWLGRLLLRLARSKPLWDSRPMMEIIVDSGEDRESFASFVGQFSPRQTRIITAASPVDVVVELHRRWFARHPTGTSTKGVTATALEPMAPGSVFISYASEDREAAQVFADHLERSGLDVWMDRRLAPGDDYRSVIERHIRECSAFVPLLSKHTQTDDERWFRKEWALAADRARLYFGTDRGLLFPVVVDGTPPQALAELRRETFGRSAAVAPEGRPDSALVEQLDQAQKAWRRQFAR